MAGKSPLELLEDDPNRIQPFISTFFNPMLAGLMGFGCACMVNWGTRRPVFSGIQKHILATAGGVAVGAFVDKKRNEYLAERDAVFRHYIELHPEDFIPPERKKFGEVLLPWVPIR